MKKTIVLFSFVLFCFCAFGVIAPAYGGSLTDKNVQGTKIRIVFGNEEAIVTLFDTPVSRDFVSLLPLDVTFEDYARTEKITYLSRKLTTQSAMAGPSPKEGDFCYYAPWGNLAVFYKGFGDHKIHHLGRIESGKEKLAGMNKKFNARIEIVE